MPLEKSKSKNAFIHNLKAEHEAGKPMKQSLAIAYSVKRKAKKMADGGMVNSIEEGNAEQHQADEHDMVVGEDMEHEKDADMIARIMHKRKQYMSEGGRVANDVGVAEADKNPAEYDDLVLRDKLEESESGANSGDELGDAEQDAERHDIISKVLKSRAKKDRMPRPA